MLKTITLNWQGNSDLDAATRDASLDLQGDALCLLGRVALADEMGNCNVRDTQPIDGWTWVRKDFWLDDPRARGCRISVCAQPEGSGPAGFGRRPAEQGPANLVVEVNGHAQSVPYLRLTPEGEGRVSDVYWQLGWPTVDAPPAWLRQGQNVVILRTEDGSRWETFIEVSRAPNRSARSLDRGQSWDYEHLGYNDCYDGEFLVRMELERFAPQGALTSSPFDLATAVDESGLGAPIGVRALSLRWEGGTPPETAIRAELRLGSTPSYDPRSWGAWQPAEGFLPREGDRFGQWRITLSAQDPLATPTLSKVSISAEMEVEPAVWGRIIAADNPALVRPSRPFGYQAPTARTQMLRERWRLDEVVAGAGDDWERILKLAHWVREQWGDGWNREWKALHLCPPWDGALILELTSHDLSLGMCTHYSTAFVHACAALGIPARHVIHKAHCTSEAWSDRWGKWVWLDTGGDTDDATRAVYYVERDGAPLSALEARALWQAGDWASARLVGRNATKFDVSKRPALLDRFCIGLRNDQMTSLNPGEPEHGVMYYQYDGYLWWRDAQTSPLPRFSLSSSREGDFYWTLNRVHIHMQRSEEEGLLRVALESCMPNLAAYEASLDGGPWQESPAGFEWGIRRGENHLAVRGVNAFGHSGPASWVRVAWPPR